MALAALLTGGCISFTNVVKVKAYGSGTLETTIVMNTAVFKQVGAMMGGEMDGSRARATCRRPTTSPKDLSKMKGVRLVSQNPIKQGDVEGVEGRLAFDDVNQVAVERERAGPERKARSPKDEVKFSMVKQAGGTSVLSISFPDRPGEAVRATEPRRRPDGAGSGKTPAPEVLQMLSGFFKGMRMLIAVDVDGTLVRTSSPYVEGNRVTLLDIDMEQLLKRPGGAREDGRRCSLGPDMSVTRLREALAKTGVKGIKVNDPKITIEMR